MSERKPLSCRASGCAEVPFLGGLCRQHYDEADRRAQRRRAAIDALHTAVIDDRLPDDLALREELTRLRKWWDRACSAVQTKRDSALMPADEADYALEWCIALAQEIVDAERAARGGKKAEDTLACTRHWVWERFGNLEAGLRSNGIARSAGKSI